MNITLKFIIELRCSNVESQLTQSIFNIQQLLYTKLDKLKPNLIELKQANSKLKKYMK